MGVKDSLASELEHLCSLMFLDGSDAVIDCVDENPFLFLSCAVEGAVTKGHGLVGVISVRSRPLYPDRYVQLSVGIRHLLQAILEPSIVYVSQNAL